MEGGWMNSKGGSIIKNSHEFKKKKKKMEGSEPPEITKPKRQQVLISYFILSILWHRTTHIISPLYIFIHVMSFHFISIHFFFFFSFDAKLRLDFY
jgi:hypothetical protein